MLAESVLDVEMDTENEADGDADGECALEGVDATEVQAVVDQVLLALAQLVADVEPDVDSLEDAQGEDESESRGEGDACRDCDDVAESAGKRETLTETLIEAVALAQLVVDSDADTDPLDDAH